MKSDPGEHGMLQVRGSAPALKEDEVIQETSMGENFTTLLLKTVCVRGMQVSFVLQ